MKQSTILSVFALLNIICCNDNPVDGKSENHSPVIFSVVVFPEVVKPSDSLIVICNATDSDGDTLVYDWYTTGVVRIKGARPNQPALFNTYENSRIFYAPDSIHVSAPQDTFRVECAARDRKGGMDVQIVHFIVIRDS